MPFNGSGTFISLTPPNYPAVAGQPIYASQFNINMTDLFGGLTNCLTRDGQSPAAANLPMNGYKHTGAANASASGQYTVWGQQVTFAGITQASGYYNIYPYNGTYDDGGYARWLWDGNNGNLIFTRAGGSGAAGIRLSATGFIGDLTGAASQVLVAANGSNATRYLTFVTATSGNLPIYTDGGITYNPSANTLSVAGGIVGNLTGNADTASAVAWSGVSGKPAAVTALSGTNTGDQTTITGNAGTATKLATARNLNGTSFDGTANVTVPTNVVTDSTNAAQFVQFAVSSGNVESRINSGITFNPSTNLLTVGGEVVSAAITPTNDYSLGYRKVPRSASTAISRLYNGFCKSLSAGVTIPSATFEDGDSFSIYNNSASAFNLTQGSGLTMRGPNGSTGTLSLAAYGMAVLWFDSADVVKVMGEVS